MNEYIIKNTKSDGSKEKRNVLKKVCNKITSRSHTSIKLLKIYRVLLHYYGES